MDNYIMEVKKKRGRKPKSKEIINNNPVFDNKNPKDIIVKLDLNKNENENYDLNMCNFQLPDISNTSDIKLCWNCCYELLNLNIGLPLKFIDNIFYILGNFCSFECSAKYCFDNYYNDKYEIYSLLNLYYNKLYDTKNKKVNIAKNKTLLIKFGGDLTYEEYSKDFNKLDDIKLINVYTKELQSNIEIKNSIQNISELKLFRNIKSKNNISTIMKLDIDKK